MKQIIIGLSVVVIALLVTLIVMLSRNDQNNVTIRHETDSTVNESDSQSSVLGDGTQVIEEKNDVAIGDKQVKTKNFNVQIIQPQTIDELGGGKLMTDRISKVIVVPHNMTKCFVQYCFGSKTRPDLGLAFFLEKHLDRKIGIPDKDLKSMDIPKGTSDCQVYILDEDNNGMFLSNQNFNYLYKSDINKEGLIDITEFVHSNNTYYIAVINKTGKRYPFISEIAAIVNSNN